MKRNKLRVIVPLAVGALFLAACGGDNGDTGGEGGGGGGEAAPEGDDRPSVVSVVSGPLGDRGFFDDAERGMKKIAEAGSKTQTIESEANNRSEEHTSELQSRGHLVCRLLLEKKKKTNKTLMHSQTKKIRR